MAKKVDKENDPLIKVSRSKKTKTNAPRRTSALTSLALAQAERRKLKTLQTHPSFAARLNLPEIGSGFAPLRSGGSAGAPLKSGNPSTTSIPGTSISDMMKIMEQLKKTDTESAKSNERILELKSQILEKEADIQSLKRSSEISKNEAVYKVESENLRRQKKELEELERQSKERLKYSMQMEEALHKIGMRSLTGKTPESEKINPESETINKEIGGPMEIDPLIKESKVSLPEIQITDRRTKKPDILRDTMEIDSSEITKIIEPMEAKDIHDQTSKEKVPLETNGRKLRPTAFGEEISQAARAKQPFPLRPIPKIVEPAISPNPVTTEANVRKQSIDTVIDNKIEDKERQLHKTPNLENEKQENAIVRNAGKRSAEHLANEEQEPPRKRPTMQEEIEENIFYENAGKRSAPAENEEEQPPRKRERLEEEILEIEEEE